MDTQFANAGHSQVWNYYGLKGTQIDYVSTQARRGSSRYLVGDSLIERITVNVPIN